MLTVTSCVFWDLKLLIWSWRSKLCWLLRIEIAILCLGSWRALRTVRTVSWNRYLLCSLFLLLNCQSVNINIFQKEYPSLDASWCCHKLKNFTSYFTSPFFLSFGRLYLSFCLCFFFLFPFSIILDFFKVAFPFLGWIF